MKWNYEDAYIRHPIKPGEVAAFDNGTLVAVHDIFNPLPRFMLQADCIFVDSPWNLGNIRSFYTKADQILDLDSFTLFYKRLFECIKEIHPAICYAEIGKEYLPEFVFEMKKLYKYVTFYNSTYYHKKDNICYVVRGNSKAKKPKLDYLDEEDIIKWVCENEAYGCIGDLCIGRGLVAQYAYAAGKRKAVGTELNHKRLSVLLERMLKLDASYIIKEGVK